MSGDYSDRFDPDTDFDRHLSLATGRRIRRWFRPGDRVLELGAATGVMTAELATGEVDVDAVERLPAFHRRAVARGLPRTTVHLADVTEFRGPHRYHQVVAAQLLNELPDPLALLRRIRTELLAPGGLVHVSMTNPLSVHRLVAVEMGLIDAPDALSDRGREFATVQILDGPALERLAHRAGLECVHREPVLLKPLTSGQLADLPDAVVSGLDRVARLLPEHGALNYAILVAAEGTSGS